MPHGSLEEARRRVLQATGPAPMAPAGQWTIRDGYLKPFAAVRHTHYGVEAALRLRKHPDFSLKKIGSIRLQTYGEAVQYCGNRAPRTAIQAQFSLSYAIAAALVLGDLGPDAYADMGNATIAHLEQNIVIEVDPKRVRRGANLAIDIGEIKLTESVDNVAGDPAKPMTKEEVVEKFHRYTEPALGRQRAKALVSFVLEGRSAEPAHRCFALAS